MNEYTKHILLVIALILILIFYTGNQPQKPPGILSGFFVGVFNISKGEVEGIPFNITEEELIARRYRIVHINDTVLKNYPTLKDALLEDAKHIDLSDEEAVLIIDNFRHNIVEYNGNYYKILIGKY